LSAEERSLVNEYLCSRLLSLFLDPKEPLVIPEDAYNRIETDIDGEIDKIDLSFTYQDFYAYQFIDKLADIVRRASSVRNLFVKKQPSKNVIKICREAYFSFLYGFHTASVSLIRAILVTMLKDHLNTDVGALGSLNNMAKERGIYGDKTWSMVDRIRIEANTYVREVSQGKSPSESKNLQILRYAQEVMERFLRI
jgi:hypothetical protein